jgi:hypothetical protein
MYRLLHMDSFVRRVQRPMESGRRSMALLSTLRRMRHVQRKSAAGSSCRRLSLRRRTSSAVIVSIPGCTCVMLLPERSRYVTCEGETRSATTTFAEEDHKPMHGKLTTTTGIHPGASRGSMITNQHTSRTINKEN